MGAVSRSELVDGQNRMVTADEAAALAPIRQEHGTEAQRRLSLPGSEAEPVAQWFKRVMGE